MAEWTTQAADAIERVVGAVRDKTVRPAQTFARAVVHGLLTMFLVSSAAILLGIGAFRGLVILTGAAWAAYFIVGGIFVVAGTLCWVRRAPRPAKAAR